MRFSNLYIAVQMFASCIIIAISVVSFEVKITQPWLTFTACVFIMFVVMMIWSYLCNNKTHSQRLRINQTENNLKLYIDDVSYEDHYEKLLMFKNPFNLYGPQAVKDRSQVKPIDRFNWWS